MRLLTLATVAALGLAVASPVLAERLTDQPLVDAAWLKSNLGNESLVVLDVRDAVEKVLAYDTAHIPGAISAPYSTSGWREEIDGVPGQFPGVEKAAALIGKLGVDNDEHVVIVPNGTDSSEFGAATRIYWTFKVLGHDAVSILDGGARAWEAAGGEVTAEASLPEPATFTANFRSELLATTAQVQQAIADGVTLVDGRPAAQYRGEAKSPVVARAGTLPGAVNLENSALYDAEGAKFADRTKVAALAFNAGLYTTEQASLASGGGAGEGKPAIAFCNTGHWASIVWFGLHEVGGNHNVTMYDGSMAEWAADPARPVQ